MEERIWEVGKSVRCAECTRFHGVHSRTPVVVHGRSEVEPTQPMMGPGGSTVGPLMHHDELTWRMDWMLSEVYVGTVDAGVGGKGGVKFGWAEMINCYDGDWDEEVPQVGVEGGMTFYTDRDETIFKSTCSTDICTV